MTASLAPRRLARSKACTSTVSYLTLAKTDHVMRVSYKREQIIWRSVQEQESQPALG